MSRRRRMGVALIAYGTVALGFAFAASPASADAPEQTGWWFEAQTKSLPAPLPLSTLPVVPNGGLFVQEGPQGASAYGALRYQTSGAESAILTLAAAQGSTTSLGAPLQACATTTSWQTPAAAPGYWEDAPKYSAPCTPGRISSDGGFVAFAFDKSFLKSGALDVAIVPLEGSNPFAIAFDKPAANALAVTGAPVATPPTTPTTRPAVAASPTGGGGVSASKPAAPPAAAAVAAAPAAPSDNRSSLANSALKVVGFGDPDRGERAAALGGASAIVIGWWLLSTQAVPTPRLLGGIGANAGARGPGPGAAGDDTSKEKPQRVGGVGRFARKRDRDALKLR